MESEGNPLVGSLCSFPLRVRDHFYEFSSLSDWIELRKVHSDKAVRRALSLNHKRCQYAQQKRHSADTQYRECNLHRAAGRPFSDAISNMIVPLRT
jgi:hypothetical protein